MERTYTIPLRREWLKAPRYKRAKRAVNALRRFLQRHMKSEDVRLGTNLNLEIWKHGIKNPPGKVRVNVSKDDKGVVRAELFGAPEEEKTEKQEVKKTEAKEEKKIEHKEDKKAEVNATENKEAKAETKKETSKIVRKPSPKPVK